MSDMLEWGADFLKTMMKEHASQLVELSWKVGGESKQASLKASLVDEEGRVLRNEVKLRTEHTFFMFETADLVSESVPLTRGLRILWDSQSFETVIMGSKCHFSNDAYQRTTVLVTKHVPI
jgi:hypothetical protein